MMRFLHQQMKVLCLAVSQLILPSSTQRFPENNHTRCFHFTCLFHIALEFLADTGTKCQQLHSKHLTHTRKEMWAIKVNWGMAELLMFLWLHLERTFYLKWEKTRKSLFALNWNEDLLCVFHLWLCRILPGWWAKTYTNLLSVFLDLAVKGKWLISSKQNTSSDSVWVNFFNS